jgi:hypothetical protein
VERPRAGHMWMHILLIVSVVYDSGVKSVVRGIVVWMAALMESLRSYRMGELGSTRMSSRHGGDGELG